jgi:hypothetical protein
VHAAVVEGRPLGLVTLARQEVGRQMGQVQDRQLPDLAGGDEIAHRPVVPGVAVEEVDDHVPVAGLDFSQQALFLHDGRGEGFVRQHVQAAREGSANKTWARVGEREDPDGFNPSARDQPLAIIVGDEDGHRIARQREAGRIPVIDPGHLPSRVVAKDGEVSRPHGAEPDDADAIAPCHAPALSPRRPAASHGR